ncbi:Appr-1-p processing domain protein [Croceitalea dokdonensis DOKDO 023]|uniref:Appr-1-p processing domain protein n=1 Tax=Croceitalea dokdonensis DOKDO 023 TaxID=1300341 RepID=A0A0P7AWP6_9FLAO|nr:macro domain-containing protein [Croceitalea dokdonensis]KPM32522.1 Appr-1-p processing domain protein [Croceitalea dokdonensis DOKDO 023]
MDHIKIFDKSHDITERTIDLIVAPVNKRLETSGSHKPLDYVIYNHRYALRKLHEVVPNKDKVAYGDVYLIPEEHGAQSSLMYAVLSEACSTDTKALKHFYQTSLSAAAAEGYQSIRFPSLSTGVFKYPMDQVVAAGLEEAITFTKFREIQFYCYNDVYFQKFNTQLQKLKAWRK